MALKKCKECGKEISATAIRCPHCGNIRDVICKPCLILLTGIIVLSVIIAVGVKDPKKTLTSAPNTENYPTSSASYAKLNSIYPTSWLLYPKANSAVGCDSKEPYEVRNYVFNKAYKNQWMTWRGKVVFVNADVVALDIAGKGGRDIEVEFADKNTGYNLTKGKFITIRFLMKYPGDCMFPFLGNNATIVQ